jgi:transcriptional regulator with XRE-family HTH domain
MTDANTVASANPNKSYSTHLLRHYRFKIGDNIHRIRAKLKMTLHKLAQVSDVGIVNLDHYEIGKGEISFDHLLKIACALGVEVEVLLQ